ncbi:hypothetical protein [Streptomyces sp. ME19-01-6]|uniref:hypothetical protein n=1 Tax=Streptomyces sp. ME19-01-6 TaxID=3028686 RepID=UPI0029A697D5|nr:hypothetical protein [Streptomyces sp. ME19-01-6]MDX3227652.1 hypothetical protein [Streptomyces sp. ME19-01-6]
MEPRVRQGQRGEHLGGRPDRIGELWDEGTECEVGTTVFRAERARRRDAVPADGTWQPVWAVMRAPAGVHGEANVRLAVWLEE